MTGFLVSSLTLTCSDPELAQKSQIAVSDPSHQAVFMNVCIWLCIWTWVSVCLSEHLMPHIDATLPVFSRKSLKEQTARSFSRSVKSAAGLMAPVCFSLWFYKVFFHLPAPPRLIKWQPFSEPVPAVRASGLSFSPPDGELDWTVKNV